MANIAYVNGEFIEEQDAKISIFDRGFLFADAVYEVFPVFDGKIADSSAHFARLKSSLAALEIPEPLEDKEYRVAIGELLQRNALDEGMVYMQVSRGVAERSFDFPQDPTPSLVMFTMEMDILNNPMANRGKRVITTPDIRWKRCDIKTVALLGASIAKTQATKQGMDDAWFFDEDRMITEGSSNNAYIVTTANKLITRPLSNAILPGITRIGILKLVEELGLELEERKFSIDEAYQAAEAFTSSATGSVMPVTQIDERTISNGAPGAFTLKLRKLYFEMAKQSAHDQI